MVADATEFKNLTHIKIYAIIKEKEVIKMITIARPKGTNKTKDLLEIANKQNGLVLTTEKRALQVKADSYGLKNLTIVDWSDLLYDDFDTSKPLFIHKAADVFKDYMKLDFGLNLEGFSITMEE